MGGFFGVVADHDCVCDLFYGTDYHSHLGTKRGGLAVCDREGRITRRIHDITNAQFRSKFDDDIDKFVGRAGIGIISDYEDQPLIISSKFGNFAIVTVGKINNIDEIADAAFRSGVSHFSESNDGELNPTEIVAMLINRKETLVEGIRYAQHMIDGSCSILVLIEGRVYAARDRFGRTPVMIGEKTGAYAVTMETTALPNLDYHLKHELGPGEIVEITEGGVIQKHAPGDTTKICTFFWVYYGYPTASYEGVNVEEMRYRCGSMLAKRDGDSVHPDIVAGVPDSGIAHAIGYANRAGIPFARPFIKYTPTWPRSFMPVNQNMRNLVARMKLVPVKDLIEGKRLLMVDDSIVRGTQTRETVEFLYNNGAKEVHIRSACPPLTYGCKYLNFSRSSSEMELIARRVIMKLEGEDGLKHLPEYSDTATARGKAMIEEIGRELHFSSLRFQTVQGELDSIGIDPENVCTYCWTGKE